MLLCHSVNFQSHCDYRIATQHCVRVNDVFVKKTGYIENVFIVLTVLILWYGKKYVLLVFWQNAGLTHRSPLNQPFYFVDIDLLVIVIVLQFELASILKVECQISCALELNDCLKKSAIKFLLVYC